MEQPGDVVNAYGDIALTDDSAFGRVLQIGIVWVSIEQGARARRFGWRRICGDFDRVQIERSWRDRGDQVRGDDEDDFYVSRRDWANLVHMVANVQANVRLLLKQEAI